MPKIKRPRLMIIVEGGVLQNVLSDTLVDVTLIDYDAQEMADGESVFLIPQDIGDPQEAFVNQDMHIEIDPPAMNKVLKAIEEQRK